MIKRRWLRPIAAAFSAFLANAPYGSGALALTDPVSGTHPTDLPRVGTARVVTVIDGDTVTLDDGREVRLTGIQAPKLPLGRRNFPVWPLAEEAKKALEDLILGQTVDLHVGGEAMDRHGRVLAHIVGHDGTWAQGEMVSLGLARVYTFPDNRSLAAVLLERERTARAAGRGIWTIDFYQVRTPATLKNTENQFHLIEGKILSAAQVKNTVFLNFGRYWREDFTITFPARLLDAFRAQGRDPLSWTGKTIRVRGWVTEKNGPWISVSHPEAIEGPLD